ncbi:MAG: cardiolipin synthase B [Gallionellales bacterium GWA2_60_142]|nr:MAG: cardiolipin synthase B [Gallionellales bacterium GWA2_60_142]HCI12791.1 cardiolipin synthase ClsB [Gallionellaceae bacterium]
MNGEHLVDGNRLTLLQNGTAYFPRLCADIDAARISVNLETYLYAADDSGRMIGEALRRAAARGVAVRLLLDGFGSAELPQRWVDELRAAGVEVQWFRRAVSPFTLQRNRRRRLYRLHRKLAVIDGEIAFVGGINIIDDIPAHSALVGPRLDYAVRVQGPLAGTAHITAHHLWNTVSWANLRRRGKMLAQAATQPTGDAAVSLLLRDNLRHRRDIERAYRRAISGARSEIVIANAYFLPGRAFRRALVAAAARGVRVVLLLQGRVEYWVQHYATQALYDRLLAAGIEIYEYRASHLHAKVAVVDGAWATVGSSNIDPFSLLLAREANLVVQDAGFARELRNSLYTEIDRHGQRVDRSARGFWARALARLSYGLIRLLVSLLVLPKKRNE